jgi:hypothetical protein
MILVYLPKSYIIRRYMLSTSELGYFVIDLNQVYFSWMWIVSRTGSWRFEMAVRLKSDWALSKRGPGSPGSRSSHAGIVEVGVHPRDEALEVYSAAGCRVDFDQQLVFIPEEVLKQALQTSPASFRLHGIDPGNNIDVSLEDIYTIAGSSALSVLDLEGCHRPATLQDLVDFTRLIDALDQAHIMHAMVVPQDIPQPGFDRILFSTILKNTQKHYYSQGQGALSVQDQVEMAAVIQGSTEAVRHARSSAVVCFNSPLYTVQRRLQGDGGLRSIQHPRLAGADEYDGVHRADHGRRRAGRAYCQCAGRAGADAAAESGTSLHLIHCFRGF